jgi:hypothetical protein
VGHYAAPGRLHPPRGGRGWHGGKLVLTAKTVHLGFVDCSARVSRPRRLGGPEVSRLRGGNAVAIARRQSGEVGRPCHNSPGQRAVRAAQQKEKSQSGARGLSIPTFHRARASLPASPVPVHRSVPSPGQRPTSSVPAAHPRPEISGSGGPSFWPPRLRLATGTGLPLATPTVVKLYGRSTYDTRPCWAAAFVRKRTGALALMF